MTPKARDLQEPGQHDMIEALRDALRRDNSEELNPRMRDALKGFREGLHAHPYVRSLEKHAASDRSLRRRPFAPARLALAAAGVAAIVVIAVVLLPTDTGRGVIVIHAPATAQTMAEVDLNQIKDATLKTLLMGMKYNYDAVQSAEGTFRMTVTTNPDSKVPYSGGVHSIRWTFSDGAFREETDEIEGGVKNHPCLEVIVFDGTTGYVHLPEHNHGAVISADLLDRSRVSSNVAAWLKLAYRFDFNPRKPPWQPIVESGGMIRGEETLNEVACYRVESPPDQKGRRHTWWIAPDRGYCIKRYERMGPGEGPIEYRRFTEETLEFTQELGIYLPSAIKQVFLTKRHGEAEAWHATWEFNAEELQINPSVDRGIFSMAFPETTTVITPQGERGAAVGTAGGLSRPN